MTEEKSSILSKIKPFLFSGIAAVTSSIILHPLLTTKIRIQLYNENLGFQNQRKTFINPKQIIKKIYKEEKLYGFFKGLNIAITRELIFGPTKLGIYRYHLEKYIRKLEKDEKINFFQRTKFLLYGGIAASIVGCPLDLALTRVQADNSLPENQRRNYKNVFNALEKIYTEEGFKSLWRGFTPFTLRVVIITITSVSAFEEAKNFFMKKEENKENISFAVRCKAILVSSFFLPVTGLPVDNIKTKMQKMVVKGENEKKIYKGFFDCLRKSVKREGVLGLWSGFFVYYAYKAPGNMINLVVLDYLVLWFGDCDVKFRR